MGTIVIDTEGRAFYRDRGHFVRDRGRSLKRLHRPNRFRVWLHGLKGEGGSRYPYGFGPVYLNEGLRKPRRGFTLAAAKKIRGARYFFPLTYNPLSFSFNSSRGAWFVGQAKPERVIES